MGQLSAEEIRELIATVPHWHQVIQFPHGIASPGTYAPAHYLEHLGLEDLEGQRVLDVGTRDGFFAFHCEGLGAEVVAVDHADPAVTGFAVAKQILDSKIEYIQANVYDLTPAEFGSFDLILFLGVLYHLRHPLLALDRLRELANTGALLLVESLVCDERFFFEHERHLSLRETAPTIADLPLAQFLPTYRFQGDGSNKWSPNLAGLEAMVQDAGFEIERTTIWAGDRAIVAASAIADPERQRLIDMDRGRRDVP